jgi:hypothetical protein
VAAAAASTHRRVPNLMLRSRPVPAAAQSTGGTQPPQWPSPGHSKPTQHDLAPSPAAARPQGETSPAWTRSVSEFLLKMMLQSWRHRSVARRTARSHWRLSSGRSRDTVCASCASEIGEQPSSSFCPRASCRRWLYITPKALLLYRLRVCDQMWPPASSNPSSQAIVLNRCNSF